jgi:phenylalanyl-tRNA synthetase beta chain
VLLSSYSKGKITYEARPPKDIKFAPLNKDTVYTAEEMMELYEVNKDYTENTKVPSR